jgi:hypothetical protein
MLGTSAAAISSLVAGLLPYESAALKFSSAAAIVGTVICLIGVAVSFLLPEPAGSIED